MRVTVLDDDSGMGSATWIASPIRYYGNSAPVGDASYHGQFVAGGSVGSAPWARLDGPTSKGWVIVTACYDDVTRQTTLGLNGVDSNSVFKTTGLAIDENSYWAIGYQGSPSSLLDSGVGDTYIFNDCLSSTDSGQRRLAALVAAMRTAYGIA